MKLKIEEKNVDGNTKTIWTRIFIESDDQKKETTVLVGVSRQYYLYQIGVKTIEDFPFDKWVKNVANKWKSFGDQIFEKKVHCDAYANNIEGEDNVRKFLRTKIKF